MKRHNGQVYPGTELILYVEDDPINQQVMESVLVSRQGTRLVCAQDEESTLSALEEEECWPDVVLMDNQLVNTTGTQVMAAMTKVHGRIFRFVVCAAKSTSEAEALMRETNALGYICKPFSPDNLFRTLDIISALPLPAARARESSRSSSDTHTVAWQRSQSRSAPGSPYVPDRERRPHGRWQDGEARTVHGASKSKSSPHNSLHPVPAALKVFSPPRVVSDRVISSYTGEEPTGNLGSDTSDASCSVHASSARSSSRLRHYSTNHSSTPHSFSHSLPSGLDSAGSNLAEVGGVPWSRYSNSLDVAPPLHAVLGASAAHNHNHNHSYSQNHARSPHGLPAHRFFASGGPKRPQAVPGLFPSGYGGPFQPQTNNSQPFSVSPRPALSSSSSTNVAVAASPGGLPEGGDSRVSGSSGQAGVFIRCSSPRSTMTRSGSVREPVQRGFSSAEENRLARAVLVSAVARSQAAGYTFNPSRPGSANSNSSNAATLSGSGHANVVHAHRAHSHPVALCASEPPPTSGADTLAGASQTSLSAPVESPLEDKYGLGGGSGTRQCSDQVMPGHSGGVARDGSGSLNGFDTLPVLPHGNDDSDSDSDSGPRSILHSPWDVQDGPESLGAPSSAHDALISSSLVLNKITEGGSSEEATQTNSANTSEHTGGTLSSSHIKGGTKLRLLQTQPKPVPVAAHAEQRSLLQHAAGRVRMLRSFDLQDRQLVFAHDALGSDSTLFGASPSKSCPPATDFCRSEPLPAPATASGLGPSGLDPAVAVRERVSPPHKPATAPRPEHSPNLLYPAESSLRHAADRARLTEQQLANQHVYGSHNASDAAQLPQSSHAAFRNPAKKPPRGRHATHTGVLRSGDLARLAVRESLRGVAPERRIADQAISPSNHQICSHEGASQIEQVLERQDQPPVILIDAAIDKHLERLSVACHDGDRDREAAPGVAESERALLKHVRSDGLVHATSAKAEDAAPEVVASADNGDDAEGEAHDGSPAPLRAQTSLSDKTKQRLYGARLRSKSLSLLRQPEAMGLEVQPPRGRPADGPLAVPAPPALRHQASSSVKRSLGEGGRQSSSSKHAMRSLYATATMQNVPHKKTTQTDRELSGALQDLMAHMETELAELSTCGGDTRTTTTWTTNSAHTSNKTVDVPNADRLTNAELTFASSVPDLTKAPLGLTLGPGTATLVPPGLLPTAPPATPRRWNSQEAVAIMSDIQHTVEVLSMPAVGHSDIAEDLNVTELCAVLDLEHIAPVLESTECSVADLCGMCALEIMDLGVVDMHDLARLMHGLANL